MASADTEVMTTALHITLISETFPPEINGVANTLGRLCEGLRARGHQVELVRPRQGVDQSRLSDDELVMVQESEDLAQLLRPGALDGIGFVDPAVDLPPDTNTPPLPAQRHPRGLQRNYY